MGHWSRVTVPGKWPFFFFFGQDMCHDYSVRRWGLRAAVWAQILTLCSGARRRQRRPHGASSRGWCGDGWRVKHPWGAWRIGGPGGLGRCRRPAPTEKRSARAARRSAAVTAAARTRAIVAARTRCALERGRPRPRRSP